MQTPTASVIICVYNRAAQVVACLDSLLELDLEGTEIVLVDDGSTDDTPEGLAQYVQAHPGTEIRIVTNPRNLGVSGARNAGLGAARGEFVAFTDSDCTVDPAWLRLLVEAFDSARVAAASGTVIDHPPRTWAERAYVGTCRIRRQGVQSRPLIGNNMCFRREIAQEFEFDPALAYGCDEDELAWRLGSRGYELRFAPEAIVYHDHAMDLEGYLSQASRQGEGSARYWYKRGTYMGRDLGLLAAAFLTLPFGLLDRGFWLLPAAFFLLQLGAMFFNEVALKGKRPSEAVVVLPACLAYNLVKLRSVLRTLLRISAGREPAIRASKRRWRKQLRAANV